LVLRELQFEFFHGSAHTLQHFERNSEFSIARGADCNGWSRSQPLEDAEIALRHGEISYCGFIQELASSDLSG